MNLFVEAEFILDFEITFDENRATLGQNVLFRIFKEYTELKIYFDDEDLLIKEDSIIFNLLTDNQPDYSVIGSFVAYFSTNKLSSEQTIVLTKATIAGKAQIESKGGICLSWNDFEERIKFIFNSIHQEYLLSENEFDSWALLNKFSILPIKKVMIEDPYILSNNFNQKITENLIPLISNLLMGQKEKSPLYIYTSKILNKYEEDHGKKIEKALKERYYLLLSRLSKYVNQIVFIESNVSKKEYYQHDRYLYTSFGLISVGEGFNLFPLTPSNSSVICSTIFDKGTFKKHKAHIKKLENLSSSTLQNDEKIYKFKIFPVGQVPLGLIKYKKTN
jgi:hypothetical protein